jgi:flagellar motor switch protein FliM
LPTAGAAPRSGAVVNGLSGAAITEDRNRRSRRSASDADDRPEAVRAAAEPARSPSGDAHPRFTCPNFRGWSPRKEAMGTEALNQSEVDALMTAAESGDAAADSIPTQIFSRARRDSDQIDIQPYDFKRPERISKDQMRALEMLHETFARNFGASLSGFLRTIVEVKVVEAAQMTYSEFIASLPNPTSFNLVRCPPLEGQICLEISPLVNYPIIDRLLGGSNKELFIPQRPMTMIETRLIQKILQRATVGLQESWAGIRKIEFALGEMESNPQLVQIVPPNEVVVVIGFEVKLTSRTGPMSLCIPYNVIEPLMEDLSSQNWFAVSKNQRSKETEAQLVRNLTRAPLEVTGVLATTTITMQDLLGLSVGDIIVTETPASKPISVCVERERKFLAHLGQFKGNRALKIVGVAAKQG